MMEFPRPYFSKKMGSLTRPKGKVDLKLCHLAMMTIYIYIYIQIIERERERERERENNIYFYKTTKIVEE